MNKMIKQHKSLDVFQVVITLILSSFLLILTLYKPLNQDEGVFLTIGRFLHNGVLPYRDIFDHKVPGIYLLNYIILGITTNIVFIKIIFVAINLCSVVLVTKIYQKISSNVRYIYLPAIFYLIMLIIFEGNFLITEIPMIFCLLLALNFALQNNKNYFLIGLFCGLAIIFKQTALISSLIIIIYSVFKSKKDITKIVLSFFLPILLVLFYLIISRTLKFGFEQIIWLNLCCYPKEPIYIVIKSLSFYFLHSLPILFLAAFELFFIAKNFRSERNMIIITLLLLLPIPFLLIRHYPHYWIQIIPFISILAASGMERIINNKYFLLKIFAFASILLILVINFRWFRWQFSQKYIEQYHEQYQAISYLEANNLNEIIAENQFSFFSFYNSSKPLSKYLYITEINNQNNQAEKKIIELLETNRNITLLWPEDQNYTLAKKLQQYIIENYQKKKVFSKLGLVIYIKK